MRLQPQSSREPLHEADGPAQRLAALAQLLRTGSLSAEDGAGEAPLERAQQPLGKLRTGFGCFTTGQRSAKGSDKVHCRYAIFGSTSIR